MMVSSQSYYVSCIGTLSLFFLVSVALCTLACPTRHYCRHDQRDALLEFKHEFPVSSGYDRLFKSGRMDSDCCEASEGGLCRADWLFSSWNKSNDCCTWEGVTCDAKSGQVISLELFDSILNSSWKTDTSLLKLQHLQVLTLNNCSLYGEIPSFLGNLSHLTLLDLWGNELVGQVPASLGNLTKLDYLNLGDNNLSGNIPVTFASLAKLSSLDVGGNQFTIGKFLFLLPNLTRLFYLNLNSNNFQSKFSPDLSGLHNLEYFDASENSFSGPFPKYLFKNPLLLLVNLGGNQFKGPIEFSNASSSSKLQHLHLSHNLFSGSIPESISKLVNLRFLDLSNNKLEGQVPGVLRRLGTLELSDNAFSSFGRSWEASEDDSTMQVLKVNSNSFQGPFPHWICHLGSLRLLELSNNLFNGSIPPCLGNSTSSLQVLALRNNSLTGILPDIFASVTYLSVLDVSRNQLEGKLPKSLINCMWMQFLNVARNKIKDEFPSWLGSLGLLNVLVLRSNQFYGSLYHRHVSTGFQSLRVIDVSHNDFTGTLPPFYFSNWPEMTTLGGQAQGDDSVDDQYMAQSLNSSSYTNSMEIVNKGVDLEYERIRIDFKAIDFSENKLRGNIPESIGLLKGLHLLNLSGNAFTGNIPQSLENLKNLEALDLSRNRLSGQIPRGLASLSSLSYMNFSHNNLEGPIPRSTQFQSQNCSSFMSNPRLSGLEEICAKTHVPNPMPQLSEELSEPEEEQVINWIAAAIAYGPGVFCGLVIGYIFASHR